MIRDKTISGEEFVKAVKSGEDEFFDCVISNEVWFSGRDMPVNRLVLTGSTFKTLSIREGHLKLLGLRKTNIIYLTLPELFVDYLYLGDAALKIADFSTTKIGTLEIQGMTVEKHIVCGGNLHLALHLFFYGVKGIVAPEAIDLMIRGLVSVEAKELRIIRGVDLEAPIFPSHAA